MQTVTLWILFQVFPFVLNGHSEATPLQPITATATAYTCMKLAQEIEDSRKEGEEVLMKCKENPKGFDVSGKVEVLVEFI